MTFGNVTTTDAPPSSLLSFWMQQHYRYDHGHHYRKIVTTQPHTHKKSRRQLCTSKTFSRCDLTQFFSFFFALATNVCFGDKCLHLSALLTHYRHHCSRLWLIAECTTWLNHKILYKIILAMIVNDVGWQMCFASVGAAPRSRDVNLVGCATFKNTKEINNSRFDVSGDGCYVSVCSQLYFGCWHQ